MSAVPPVQRLEQLNRTPVSNTHMPAVKIVPVTPAGERVHGKFGGKGLGTETGFNEFMATIAKNSIEKARINPTFSKTANNELIIQEEAKKFLKALSLNGNFARSTMDTSDFISSSGRSENKIFLKMNTLLENLYIKSHPKHTLAQLISVVVEVILGKYRSMVGINILKDGNSFKIRVVIGVIAKKNKMNCAKLLTRLIRSNSYEKYELDNKGILTTGTEDLSKKLEALSTNTLRKLYEDLMNILSISDAVSKTV